MIQQLDRGVARGWRPQEFGRKGARDIRDPLIEPLWIGERVLVHVDRDAIEIVDAAGETIRSGVGEILDGIRLAALADSLVLDGYLTRQATTSLEGRPIGELRTFSATEMTAQLFLGARGLRKDVAETAETETAARVIESPLAFVAVDLLALDGSPLIDIPLLERKRLLESALDEGYFVRRSAYIRPPVDPWLGTWRAIGFVSIAYKAANGRYQPGGASDEWAIARIPQR